ncbi:MAG: diaminopimelate epimerase [Pyrinomonadaceae bacterium]
MSVRFSKFHGLGNDYIVIEAEQLGNVASLGEFAKQICNRHYGAGADGIAVISPDEGSDADFRVRIFNPDGSEAGLSGNGTRCAVAYAYYVGLWNRNELRLNTRSGIKRYYLVEELAPGNYVFDSELGQPQFDSPSIPMITEPPLERVVNYPLVVGDESAAVTALQMGNPNCCIFVDSFDDLDWRRLGPLIENHKQFPDRTNVVFIQVRDRETLELRIWERRVGETTASGTCSCAAAVAAMINGHAERLVNVVMPGGQVRIQWRDDGEVKIKAPVELVYRGEWLAPAKTSR